MTKHNRQIIAGILLGIIVPLIGIFLFKEVLSNFQKYNFFKALSWGEIYQNKQMSSTFIQFGIVLNLIVFFILKWKNQLQIQTGIVLPTMIMILLAMLLKFYL